MTDPRWHATTFRFRFQLGEWTFAARRFPVARLDAHFTELGSNADELHLPVDDFPDADCFIVLSQPIADKLPVVSQHEGTFRFAPHQYQHSCVKVEGDFETYLKAQFPKDRKKKFLYKVRKYCQHVGSDKPFRQYRTADELREFYRHAAALSARTYQGQLVNKGFDSEDVEQWARLAAEGKARGWLLFHGERVVAFVAGRELTPGVFLDDFIGYDPEYSDFGPGNMLHYFALEEAFRDKFCRLWDFGEGEGSHKTRFGNVHLSCADLYCFPRARPAAMALFAAQAGLHFASRGAVTALERLQLKDRIKKLLRGQASAAQATAAAPAVETGGGDSA